MVIYCIDCQKELKNNERLRCNKCLKKLEKRKKIFMKNFRNKRK